MEEPIGSSEELPTLMEEIKAATSAAHAQTEKAPFFQALAARHLPIESYVGQLRALSVIHAVLEEALAGSEDARVASVWNDDMRKVAPLRRDLRYFEPRAVADLKEPMDAAFDIETEVSLVSLERPLALLGYLYVLEGSTLGAQVLRPLIERAFLLTDEGGLSYVKAYGSAVGAHWMEYRKRMNALQLAAGERAQIAQSALDMFKRIETVFLALYPFSPETKTCLVTSINPDAGRHAVPVDAREIQASIIAGDICFERFPYLDQRYGERGRLFARSDAAWKATLYTYEPAQILEQVRWLGRVLASRGMPTFFLHVQLELLVDGLTRAIPENQRLYEKLGPASRDLLDARRRHLTDDQLETLRNDFDLAVGPDWSARLPDTGGLLGWAVSDELEGSEDAVSSLHSWMTDRGRFPAEWIAAVEVTLMRGRTLSRGAATGPPSHRHA